MPKVIIWRDGAIETEFDPGHRDWRLGRSETNDITLLDPRKSVSRFHAELREENGRWVFIDSQQPERQLEGRPAREPPRARTRARSAVWRLQAVLRGRPGGAAARASANASVRRRHGQRQRWHEHSLSRQSRRCRWRHGAARWQHRSRSRSRPAPAPAPVPIPVPVSAPVPSPVPAVPAANRAAPPRKGVNPAIIVLLLIALLGALAAGAWNILSSRTVEPRVVQSESRAETPPSGADDVAPAAPVQDPPAATPPATDAEPTTPVNDASDRRIDAASRRRTDAGARPTTGTRHIRAAATSD